MVVLAHISDLHFGRENPQLIEGLLQSLEEAQPQLVVVSGDLTQRARSREFLAARAFLDCLPWPYLVVAGNHDIPAYNIIERFFSPWKKWQSYLGNTLEPTTNTDDFIALGINTTRRAGSPLDWSRGRINHEQVNSLLECFNKKDDKKLRVIVAHHPFWLPQEYRHRHIIGGRDTALQAMQKAEIDIILSGHVHFTYTHILNGLIVSHAGTAISDRLTQNNRNSFKIVRGNRRNLVIELREWNGRCFSTRELRSYLRNKGQWREA